MKKLLVIGIMLFSGNLWAANMGPYFWDQQKAWVNGVEFLVNVSTVDLTITNDMTVGGDLSVTGASSVTGVSTISSATVTGTLAVTGASTLTGGVSGYTTFAKTLTDSQGIATSTLTVTGASTLTGATAISTATVSGSQGLVLSTPMDVTVTSPTVKGALVVTSAGVVYVSTGTGTVASWVKVGAQ